MSWRTSCSTTPRGPSSAGDLAEVEAESVAYLVCEAAGLATEGYSLPYIARWSGGDLAQVRLTAERVITTARQVLDRCGLLDPADGIGLLAAPYAEVVGQLREAGPRAGVSASVLSGQLWVRPATGQIRH